MLPLEHKTVLITRSKDQVADFIAQLHQLGANTLTLPLINNQPINQEQLVQQVKNNYDWIIFTSANAVRYFFDQVSPDAVHAKIAAVGTKTAKLIEAQGLTIDFTPSQFTAKQLATELPVSGKETVFIPRSALAKNDMVELLTNRNCEVTTLSIYDNTPITYTPAELDNVFNQKINFITFTSGSTVKAFLQTGIQLEQEKIICIGPETAKVAEAANLPVAAIATPHTIDGMIDAMVGLG